LLPHANQSEASAQFDAANEDIVVNYQLGGDVPVPERIPEVFVLGPNQFEKPIRIQKNTAGSYSGRLHIGSASGLFRIRPVNESRAFPEIGLYRQQEELEDYGSNGALLAQIANATGGRFNPAPSAIFQAGGRRMYDTWQLWPLLLGAAIALSLAELIARKWHGLRERFRRV
jgi:hypothetical protein